MPGNLRKRIDSRYVFLIKKHDEEHVVLHGAFSIKSVDHLVDIHGSMNDVMY